MSTTLASLSNGLAQLKLRAANRVGKAQRSIKPTCVAANRSSAASSSVTRRAVAVRKPSVNVLGMTRMGAKKESSLTPCKAVAETFNDMDADTADNDAAVDLIKTPLISVCVVGASGDLAKKKIFPALFSLYINGSLPKDFAVYGFARTKMTDEEFRDLIALTLTCRIDKEVATDCTDRMGYFLERCHYQAGNYDNRDDFVSLDSLMGVYEKKHEVANRIFFLSIPPSIFVPVAHNSSLAASSTKGFTRVIVEKPFGRDAESSRQLSEDLSEVLTEDQIYRIDHYLGKELIDNLTVLRFSNLMFQPLWDRKYIKNVQIVFSEPFGTEGRGGYFDQYGIIRDIMQNHLLQVLALFAMEPPISLDAEDIRNEKVKVLRSMRIPGLDDLVVGQYKERPGKDGGKPYPSYIDDPTVPPGSLCPTFAALALFIDNTRWAGVPFMMKAGKALDKRMAEIRVQFRSVPGQLYAGLNLPKDDLTNELVIRIQPDEGIYLKINNKVPGLGLKIDNSQLELGYKTRYKDPLPDAYERLLLDVVNGDKRLFIRSDELEAAWGLFTPLLHQLETDKVQPELYPYGSRGPIGAHYLAGKYGVKWGDISDST